MTPKGKVSAFVVKVAYRATSKRLAVPAKSALHAALRAGYECRATLARPISYLVMRDGVNQLALTETEMQGLRNRQIMYTTQLEA